MEIPKGALVPQVYAVMLVKAAIDEGQEFKIYALPVSDSLDASMGWYMSFSDLGDDSGERYLCNAKNNVRVFKSLDSLFKVAQDNFTAVVTVCCV
tara:strand:+ start:267 stop:551 length:285 start_codon:yes stop_codon:yes gene_type:complete